MKNWFLSRTLIAPYFDEDFSISEFNTGAKHACVTVANNLAAGDFLSTKHLLSTECWDQVQSRLRSWNLQDRINLEVQPEDIYFSFLYQIGIMMEEHPTRENDSTRH